MSKLNVFCIVGATGKDNSRGAAYVFRKNASNSWVQIQKLVPPDCTSNCGFGASDNTIGLSGDTMIVSLQLFLSAVMCKVSCSILLPFFVLLKRLVREI
jgi:hypothetical protein